MVRPARVLLVGSVNTGVPSGTTWTETGFFGPSDTGTGRSSRPVRLRCLPKYLIRTTRFVLSSTSCEGHAGALLPTKERRRAQRFPPVFKTHVDLVDVDGGDPRAALPPSFGRPSSMARTKLRYRLWADYVANRADYTYDDSGAGGLTEDANFVTLEACSGSHSTRTLPGGY